MTSQADVTTSLATLTTAGWNVSSAFGGAPLSSLGVYNASALPKSRTAIAKVLGGSAQMKIAFVGDSVTSGTTGSGVDFLFTSSHAYRVAAMLTARGLPCRTDAAIGGHSASINSPGTYNAYDPRVTMGANVSPLASFSSFGYSAFHDAAGAAAAADTWVFTPPGAFDRIDCYFPTNPGWGSIAVNVDGAASLGTLNCNQANDLKKTTFSTPRVTGGTHAINFVCTGDAYFFGAHAYDSTIPAIHTLNFGINGASSVNYGGTAFPWDPGVTGSLAKFSPDCTVIFLGLNDCSALTSKATYLARIQYYITEAKASGDCILIGLWGTTNDAGDSFRSAYTDALRALAVSNGVTLIDTYPLYGTYTNSIALGLTDGLHPSHAGQADLANIIATMLSRLI